MGTQAWVLPPRGDAATVVVAEPQEGGWSRQRRDLNGAAETDATTVAPFGAFTRNRSLHMPQSAPAAGGSDRLRPSPPLEQVRRLLQRARPDRPVLGRRRNGSAGEPLPRAH